MSSLGIEAPQMGVSIPSAHYPFTNHLKITLTISVSMIFCDQNYREIKR